jgi:hypothetical protein
MLMHCKESLEQLWEELRFKMQLGINSYNAFSNNPTALTKDLRN